MCQCTDETASAVCARVERGEEKKRLETNIENQRLVESRHYYILKWRAEHVVFISIEQLESEWNEVSHGGALLGHGVRKYIDSEYRIVCWILFAAESRCWARHSIVFSQTLMH